MLLSNQLKYDFFTPIYFFQSNAADIIIIHYVTPCQYASKSGTRWYSASRFTLLALPHHTPPELRNDIWTL
jgi:hypothetical protein